MDEEDLEYTVCAGMATAGTGVSRCQPILSAILGDGSLFIEMSVIHWLSEVIDEWSLLSAEREHRQQLHFDS